MKLKVQFLASLLCLISFQGYAWHVIDKEVEVPVLIEEPLAEMKKNYDHQAVLNVTEMSEPLVIERKSKILKKPQTLGIKKIDPSTINTAAPKNIDDNNVFEKKTALLTTEEQAVNNYSKALELLSNGKESKAILLLESALESFPKHSATRTELARLYLKNNQDLEAQIVLEEGLKITDQHPEILKLLAIVFDRKNEPHKAIEFLNKIPEERKLDKNTVAFLGHVYQRAGFYQKAKQQYNMLLDFEPNNPLWLLGKSIALDSEGKAEAALEGYHRLQAECTLEPHLLKYVKERVSELKG